MQLPITVEQMFAASGMPMAPLQPPPMPPAFTPPVFMPQETWVPPAPTVEQDQFQQRLGQLAALLQAAEAGNPPIPTGPPTQAPPIYNQPVEPPLPEPSISRALPRDVPPGMPDISMQSYQNERSLADFTPPMDRDWERQASQARLAEDLAWTAERSRRARELQDMQAASGRGRYLADGSFVLGPDEREPGAPLYSDAEIFDMLPRDQRTRDTMIKSDPGLYAEEGKRMRAKQQAEAEAAEAARASQMAAVEQRAKGVPRPGSLTPEEAQGKREQIKTDTQAGVTRRREQRDQAYDQIRADRRGVPVEYYTAQQRLAQGGPPSLADALALEYDPAATAEGMYQNQMMAYYGAMANLPQGLDPSLIPMPEPPPMPGAMPGPPASIYAGPEFEGKPIGNLMSLVPTPQHALVTAALDSNPPDYETIKRILSQNGVQEPERDAIIQGLSGNPYASADNPKQGPVKQKVKSVLGATKDMPDSFYYWGP